MIGELLISYVFDRLDKQIIRRIPYALLISLFIHLMTLFFNFFILRNRPRQVFGKVRIIHLVLGMNFLLLCEGFLLLF